MIPRPRPAKARLFLICFVLACCASAAGQTTAPAQTVEAVLQALKSSGVDVIYSSELVPPELLAPPARDGETPVQRAREALAAHGLALRTVGANTFVVVRAPAASAGGGIRGTAGGDLGIRESLRDRRRARRATRSLAHRHRTRAGQS